MFTWRGVVNIAVIVGALIYLLPTFNNDLWPHKKINLGLDLQGGMHLVLEVQTEKAVETTIERTTDELKQELRKKEIKHLGISSGISTGAPSKEKNTITVELQGEENLKGFNAIVTENFNDFKVDSTTTEGDKHRVVLSLPNEESINIQKLATAQALETIRNRIDAFGVSEPDIRLQGENRIQIQLPGIKDTKRAKELIGRTARLNFQLVDENANVDAAAKGAVPPGDELLYQVGENKNSGSASKLPFLIQKRVLLDGSALTDARVEIDSQFNEPYVSIEFDRKGARIFERITGENIKKRLAIVLDKNVYSAPVIQDKIAGGKARITGNFTMEEAKDLAIVLRAGALPAPVKIIEERTVGPTLGADSIRMGLIASIVGGLVVIIVMAIYYQGAGVIADIALVVNVILLAAGLAAFQATLTLPGIAGIVLTIGMAVDANVLIYERIREELAMGKTVAASINAGFERAAVTIIDSNVTTLISAIVLFQFGTGPIKGFAITLALGLISSMFTALILSKSIFQYFVSVRKISRLSI